MNLKELENFSLSHAVELHSVLNPELWSGEKLKPGVRQQLLRIAEDFMDHMGVPDINVADITLTGSNAAYTYTPHSDIDLHILVDVGKLKNDELYRELFNAKKVVYNSSHDIKVHGYDVELYVEDTREPAKSLGEYSVLKDKWNRFPGKTKVALDEPAAKRKFQKLVQLAELALRSGDLSRVNNLLDTIRRYRRTGLERSGEFSPENIAFKALRSRGIVDKLYSHSNKLHSKELSLAERGGQIVNDDWHPNDTPPGPETKPTMPRGTVRVDVSDVYDWYKLGQHISNLHGLGKHDFGKGPPSTILSFGDEDTEHRYIKDLEATGLTTTDIDPVDPDQPKGMPRQKVDPTYNVNETFDQPYPLKWEKGQFGDWDALARLDDGTYLSIMFNNEYKKNWMVEFYRNNSQEVTGLGDAQRVFATVLTAIRQFIKKKKPASLFFSAVKADDPSGSRTRLYDRLVERFAASLGYTVQRTEHSGQTAYKLILNQHVKETMGVIEKINQEITKPGFAAEKIIQTTKGQIRLAASTPVDGGEVFPQFYIRGYNSDGKEVSYLRLNLVGLDRFSILPWKRKNYSGAHLVAGSVTVNRDYQRLGIAAEMYKFAKELGGDIKPSNTQTSDGKAMWQGFSKKSVVEGGSGYIPSKAEKNDPRFKTALTVDVKPDSIKKNAEKLGLGKIHRSGRPPTARSDGLVDLI